MMAPLWQRYQPGSVLQAAALAGHAPHRVTCRLRDAGGMALAVLGDPHVRVPTDPYIQLQGIVNVTIGTLCTSC